MDLIKKFSPIIISTSIWTSCLAGPMPVGTATLPVQGGCDKPTPEWAKNHIHSRSKNFQIGRCIKECIKRIQHVNHNRSAPAHL